MAENNGIAKMPDYRTIVQKTGAAYIPLVEKQISNGGSVDLYQHLCMENALTMMHETAVGAGLEGISALQKSEIMQILQQVATLRLNAFSRPRECYFQTRKKKQPDGNWTTSIEMGIEGDGNDVILRNFGHGVEEVYPYWDVHVDDEFTYPVHHGIDVEPPTWKRCGTGKYARVVYPVRFTDGTVRYFISERAEVRANLVAHINNNMMNETFGIAESRYKATLQQKQQIDARKSELKALMDGKDIDEILDIPELKPYISPAWMEGSRERMILRKMRNNAVKPIPKDFANELSLSAYYKSMAVSESDNTIDAEYREITDMDALPSGPQEVEMPPAAPPRSEPAPAPVEPTSKVEQAASAAPPVTRRSVLTVRLYGNKDTGQRQHRQCISGGRWNHHAPVGMRYLNA